MNEKNLFTGLVLLIVIALLSRLRQTELVALSVFVIVLQWILVPIAGYYLGRYLYYLIHKQDPLGPLQREWVEYLKAHPEEQLMGKLGKRWSDGPDVIERCCCLGRGGLIAGVCEWDCNRLVNKEGNDRNQALHDFQALGLRSPTGLAKNHRKFATLSYNNDCRMSWPEIAHLLETHPEQYFTHRV